MGADAVGHRDHLAGALCTGLRAAAPARLPFLTIACAFELATASPSRIAAPISRSSVRPFRSNLYLQFACPKMDNLLRERPKIGAYPPCAMNKRSLIERH